VGHAKDLRAGDATSGPDGPRVGTGIRTFMEVQQVFNMSVENIHTYYVLARNGTLLVHNTSSS
jgi:hypothetical protein